MSAVMNVEGGEFRASVTENATGISVSLAGIADGPAQDDLARILAHTHRCASRGDNRPVEVDVRELVFMSSSCLKELITWLEHTKNARGGWRITFLASEERAWQARSLRALSLFASELVSVQQG